MLKWTVDEQDFSGLNLPKTSAMFILADSDRAFELSSYPNEGVGLLRLEFAISNSIRIHPLALCEPEKIIDKKLKKEIEELTKDYKDGKDHFVDRLAESVALVTAAFYPNDVIARLSDFKSNEYANLLGGKYSEPHEENPMIGLRGASRYYSDFYRKGFTMECKAMKKIREEMKANDLVHGQNGLEVYVMIEIPSNVLLADEFAKLFDGLSIGSNDLTRLTLGIDRDSSLVSYLFNEENPAVKGLIKDAIRAAKRNHIKVGCCGQAPSNVPAFAEFLIEENIDSISFNPNALIKGIENMNRAENQKNKEMQFWTKSKICKNKREYYDSKYKLSSRYRSD